jgi:hypothetical protein
MAVSSNKLDSCKKLLGFFSSLGRWMDLADFKKNSAMLALEKGSIAFCNEPEAFCRTAMWAAF